MPWPTPAYNYQHPVVALTDLGNTLFKKKIFQNCTQFFVAVLLLDAWERLYSHP